MRLRGDLGPLATEPLRPCRPRADRRRPPPRRRRRGCCSRDRIEDAEGGCRLIVAGRLLADALHEVDAARRRADHRQRAPSRCPPRRSSTCSRPARRSTPTALAEAADGSVRVIATALDQALRDPRSDAVAIASHLVRVGERDRAAPARPARPLGRRPARARTRHRPAHARPARWRRVRPRRGRRAASRCGDRSPGRSSWRRPRRCAARRSTRPSPATLADDMLAARPRPRGDHAGARRRRPRAGDEHDPWAHASPSPTPSSRSRCMSLLARLGSSVERDPELLLRRAGASRQLGRLDEAAADIDRAVESAVAAPPPVRRRVAIESARARLTQGDVASGRAHRPRHPARGRRGRGPDVSPAPTRCSASARWTPTTASDLQRAAESLPGRRAGVGVVLGVRPWPHLPAHARARRPRPARALRRGARPDRRSCSHAPDLTDAERSYDLLAEGFVLCNANRLDAAELRFERTADLGYLQDNPRLIAARRVGSGRHGRPPQRSADDAALDRHGREHERRRSAPTTCSVCRSCATSPRCSVRSARSRRPRSTSTGPATVPRLHRPAAVGDVHARCPPGAARRPGRARSSAQRPRSGGGRSSSRRTRWPHRATCDERDRHAPRRRARARVARVRRLRVARRRAHPPRPCMTLLHAGRQEPADERRRCPAPAAGASARRGDGRPDRRARRHDRARRAGRQPAPPRRRDRGARRLGHPRPGERGALGRRRPRAQPHAPAQRAAAAAPSRRRPRRAHRQRPAPRRRP